MSDRHSGAPWAVSVRPLLPNPQPEGGHRMTDTNLPATIPENDERVPTPGVLTARTREEFDLAARKIGALLHNDILPAIYRKEGNLLIALDVAERTGVPLLAVCQNLHIIKGKPGWSAPFIIAAINECGRYDRLRFHVEGEGEARGCHCTATELATGEALEGTRITMKQVRIAGWKSEMWKVIPDQMLKYRAAGLWCREHEPTISQGLLTIEEVRDIRPEGPPGPAGRGAAAGGLGGGLRARCRL